MSAQQQQAEWASAIEVMTPEKAKQLIAGSDFSNRKLDTGHIARIATEIRAGRWMVTPQGISITADGKVIDGQHRLHAIAQAGAPVPVAVYSGVDEEKFVAFDSVAKTRSIGDFVQILGIGDKYHAQTATTLRLLRTWNDPSLAGGRKSQMSPTEVGAFAADHPDLVQWVPIGSQLTNACGLNSAAAAVALYLTSRARPDIDQSEWIDGVRTGAGLEAGDPRLKLRTFSMQRRAARIKNSITGIDWLNLNLKAWNAWVEGRQILQLKMPSASDRTAITSAMRVAALVA